MISIPPSILLEDVPIQPPLRTHPPDRCGLADTLLEFWRSTSASLVLVDGAGEAYIVRDWILGALERHVLGCGASSGCERCFARREWYREQAKRATHPELTE